MESVPFDDLTMASHLHSGVIPGTSDLENGSLGSVKCILAGLRPLDWNPPGEAGGVAREKGTVVSLLVCCHMTSIWAAG